MTKRVRNERRRLRYGAAIAAATLLMAGGAAMASTEAGASGEHPLRVRDSEDDIARRVDALLARMTVQEKAGQLSDVFVFDNPTARSQAEAPVAAGKVGALLFVSDPAEINRLQRIAVEKSRLGIPLLFGFDVIHGLRTIFPVPIANAASWDPEGVSRAQEVAARESRAVGIHWTFAPMVDISRDGRWGRMVEGAGEDPYLGSAMAAAQVRGFQGDRIGAPGSLMAGPKHFAGYGAALGGRDYEEVEIPDEALWNVYLPPFKAAIDAGAANIMSAYMPLNGVPATGNHWLLTDVLRKTWGFKGFVVSDAGAVESLRTHGIAGDWQQAAAKALDAGVDMEMTSSLPKFRLLPEAIAAGRVSMEKLDQAVRRVLEVKFRMGLFDHPYVDERRVESVLSDRRSLSAARIAAERAAVLLRNDGGLLPLDRSRVRRLAVIGELAASGADILGPWVFKQNRPVQGSIVDAIRSATRGRVEVTYAQGVSIPPRRFSSPFQSLAVANPVKLPQLDDGVAIAQAVEAARTSDVAVVVVGERQEMSGESASKASFDLPGRQQAMLDAIVATGKPVVVILVNGRPVDLKDTRAAAILEMWYPGSAGGAATANLIFGDAIPGGKLPFTWPRSAAQSPMYYSHLTTHEPSNSGRRYWDESSKPAYVFGHGLSYSSFEYSGLKVETPTVRPGAEVIVSVELANTGRRSADEVAQLYVHQRVGSSARPVRELKGFQRVTLAAGERRRLTFRLRAEDLRYWSAVTRDWTLEAGTYDVVIGGDSSAKFVESFSLLDS